MIRYCQRHLIGFNEDQDPTCPQCTLAGQPPAPDHDSKEAAMAARDAERRQTASRSTKA